MAKLKKYNLEGLEIGQMEFDDALIVADANAQMIKDYLVAMRTNARQWSANTKSRDEVCHSGQKPHPQKGTGRARQGYLGAPQYKGGGRVHTPKPKFDQHVRINQKEKRAAIRHLISEKIQNKRVHILEFKAFKEPKTKAVAEFLDKLQIDKRRVLFLGEGAVSEKAVRPSEKYQNFTKSMRNLKKVEFRHMPNINGYDLSLCTDIVVFEPAIDELMVLMGGKS